MERGGNNERKAGAERALRSLAADERSGRGDASYGQEDSSAETDLLFEVHQAVPDFHFRLPDFRDSVNHLPERLDKPPGVKGPARLVKLLGVSGGHSGRRRASGQSIDHLGEIEESAAGFKNLGDPEAEKRILPRQDNLLAFLKRIGKNLPSAVGVPEPHPGAPGEAGAWRNPKKEKQEHEGKGRKACRFHRFPVTEKSAFLGLTSYPADSARMELSLVSLSFFQNILKISKRLLGCQGKMIFCENDIRGEGTFPKFPCRVSYDVA